MSDWSQEFNDLCVEFNNTKDPETEDGLLRSLNSARRVKQLNYVESLNLNLKLEPVESLRLTAVAKPGPF